MARLVNLTPHRITVVDETGRAIAVIEPSGKVARVNQIRKKVGIVNGIPIVKTEYREVTDLPPPVEGTFYIVSVLVLQALKGKRSDLLAPDTGPGSVVRDEQGRVVGVRYLMRL